MIRQKSRVVVDSKPQDPISIKEEAARYSRALPVLDELKKNQILFSFQEYKTIRGQAIAGDLVGARKGMMKIIEERKAL